MIKIFISHSSTDNELAEALIGLIRDATNLPPDDIRCTSVDGYRLAGGAETDEQLRLEVANSEVFIGILSESSLVSTYVVFELGARWGVKKYLIPLLAPGLDPSRLSNPLSSLNCLSCNSASQLHQLVVEVAKHLGLTPNSPATYQSWISLIQAAGTSSVTERQPIQEVMTETSFITIPRAVNSAVSESEVLQIVQARAAAEHPGDFSTQKYVVDNQINDWRTLQNFADSEVPANILLSILRRAGEDHPDDYSTQLYVVREQIEDWKALNR